jgi:hypothetical protein
MSYNFIFNRDSIRKTPFISFEMMIAGRQRIQGPKESIFQLKRRKIESLPCAFSEAQSRDHGGSEFGESSRYSVLLSIIVFVLKITFFNWKYAVFPVFEWRIILSSSTC